MSVAERLGITTDKAEQYGVLQPTTIGNSDALFDEAFKVGEKDPARAQILLASALLSRAQETSEGRLSAALSLMARLVANADPMMTMGPNGHHLRNEIMPSGWKEMSTSWKKLRYAWREGMVDLLSVSPENEGIVQALDEVTRLHPAEPEPVTVAIQEQFPHPKIAFMVTIIGLGFTFRTFMKEIRGVGKKRSR